jgi:hypothetical protein
MSNYSMTEIKNLINRCNDNNKSIIVDTIKNIIEEDDSIQIKLMNIEKINSVFFNKMKSGECINKFCTICQNKIKSKEHKIKLDSCGHFFHKKCINKYLKHCLTKFSCPNCKNDYNQYLKSIAINLDNKSSTDSTTSNNFI